MLALAKIAAAIGKQIAPAEIDQFIGFGWLTNDNREFMLFLDRC
jgi:hypothetical protein